MSQRSRDEKELSRSEYKTYNFTPTSFIKREIPVNERNQKPDGSYIDDPRLAQRFFNEAAAYKLLKEMTSIPVPNVISHGYDENRRLFLETELIAGTVQASQAASVCRMPATHHITPGSGPCDICRSTVSQNVESFVQNTVLPQLRNLKSYSTGLNSYVMPPRWVIDTDDRLEWPVKTSSTAEFVFVLHDLVDHNILVDTCTLQVRALVDLEESGFFPLEMQQWRVNREGQFAIYEDHSLVRSHIRLLQ